MKKSISFFRAAIILTAIIAVLQACTAPKAYQKVYLNDKKMELSPAKAEMLESNFQVYREGASGATGGKSGGGCGCN